MSNIIHYPYKTFYSYRNIRLDFAIFHLTFAKPDWFLWDLVGFGGILTNYVGYRRICGIRSRQVV